MKNLKTTLTTIDYFNLKSYRRHFKYPDQTTYKTIVFNMI